MAKSNKIQLADSEDFDYDNDEVVVNVKALLKVIEENNYQDGELVVEFDDDYYDGRTFRGVFLRKKD